MIDRYRNYQPRRNVKQQPKKKRARKLLVLCIVTLGFILVRKAFFTQNTTPTSRQSAAQKKQTEKKIDAETITSTTWQDLETAITALLMQHELDIGVGIVDINSGTTASYGVKESFHGASTTKLLTAAAFLHEVESGERTLNESLSGNTSRTHLKRMINRSDNSSWDILNRAVGRAGLEAYAKTNGLNSYKFYGNLMTASDQATFLAKLYSRKLLNEEHTKLLLSFMQNTNNEDMIPLAIPGGDVYHKYGQLEDRLHDAAILEYKNQPIALVIFTKGDEDGNLYSARIKLIQQIAREVFAIVYK